MKGKILNKARLAGAVMLATAGVAAGTAQADSLLAPLIIDGSGFETYLNFKMKGATAAANADRLHYTWIQKGNTLASMAYANRATPCGIFNNDGWGSANDMIFQHVDVNNNVDGTIAGPRFDGSTPAGHASAAGFVGMVVIADVANLDPVGISNFQPEGEMSGFGYIVNPATGDIQDYKMLNNHRSAVEGDFSAVFTSKKSVDLAWHGSAAGDQGAGSLAQTGWTMVVTGPDMAQDQGNFSSIYDPSVRLSHDARTENGAAANPPQNTPLPNGAKGLYDNDEVFYSGEIIANATCMTSFRRGDIMSPQQRLVTRNGGWTRLSISTIDGVTGIDKHRSTGAMIYRADVNPMWPGDITMQVETSGHLTTGRPHPNRPF